MRKTDELQKVGLEYDESKGYAEMIHCSNCNWFQTVYIPYGRKINDYLKSRHCPRCQCEGVLY